jgi:hypothetical protein
VRSVDALRDVSRFSGDTLTETLSEIEKSLAGETGQNYDRVLSKYNAQPDVLSSASLVKQYAGQINVIIHALGIMLCLPHILQPEEVVESVSLGAGNTGKAFDLETNRRVAEFKFITWRGSGNTIRQNSLFKDFYCLAEHETAKSKHLYVLGTRMPLKFLKGKRAIKSVLSRNVKLNEAFRLRYPDLMVVCDYYRRKKGELHIEDVSHMVPELVTTQRLD